jgi:hypothetical protein
MAFKLEVGIPADDGMITVMHTFYGFTESACEKLRDAHANICPRFGPEVKAERVTEVMYEIDDDEIPYDVGDGSHESEVESDADDGDDDG